MRIGWTCDRFRGGSWPSWSILEYGSVRDEGLVLMPWKGGEAWKDVQVVEVAVSFNQDDAVRRWKTVCQDGGSVHAAIAAAEYDHVFRCGRASHAVCQRGPVRLCCPPT